MRATMRSVGVGLALGLSTLAAPAGAQALSAGSLVPLGAGCFEDSSGPGTECSSTTQGLQGASGVAVSPDGHNVYVASRTSEAVAEFGRNADGSLRPIGCVQQSGGSGCASSAATGLTSPWKITVSPDGRNVYVISSSGFGTISEFTRNTDGTLTQLAGANGCIQEHGGSACPGNEAAVGLLNPNAITVSHDGNNVYVSFDPFGDSGVSEFHRAPDGSLTQLSGANACIDETGSGSDCSTTGIGLLGASGVAVSADGHNAYVTGVDLSAAEQGTVAEFRRSASDGSLTQATGSSACIEEAGAGHECPTVVPGLGRGGQDVILSPDGTSAYVLTQPLSGSATAQIAELRRNGDGSLTGLPSPNGCIEETGASDCATATALGLNTDTASTLAISPDGSNVYVPLLGPTGSNDVAIFDRSPSGALSQAGPSEACIEEPGAGSECTTSSKGLNYPTALAVAPDGRDVYVTFTGSAPHDGGVTPFTRALAPVCRSSSVTVPAGSTSSLSLTCTDSNPSALTIEVTSGPHHGSVSAVQAATHTIRYAPAAGFTGADSLTFGATNALGVSSARATLTITVSPPTLSHVSQSARRWAERRPRGHHRAHVQVGTRFRFTLSGAARVTLSFSRSLAGRRARGRCVKPTRANRKRHRCSRSVGAGTLSVAGRAGPNTLRFDGRVSGGHKLRPGRYTVRFTAINPHGHNARSRTLSFTILG